MAAPDGQEAARAVHVQCPECGLVLRQNPASNDGHCPRCAIRQRRRVPMGWHPVRFASILGPERAGGPQIEEGEENDG